MNTFDMGVVFLVVILGLIGFRDGLVKSAVKLIGFIAILILMAFYSDWISGLAVTFDMVPAKIAVPLAFVLIFALAVVALHFAAVLLSGIIALTPAHGLDVGLGCVFGLCKALFLGGLLALACSYGTPDSFIGKQYRSSRYAVPLHQFAITTLPLLRSAAVAVYQRFEQSLPEINQDILKDPDDTDPDNLI